MGVAKNLLIGLDQTINCLIPLSDGFGTPDETLSAREWRLRAEYPRLHVWIDRLFWWDKDHCETSWRAELLRAHLLAGYRKGAE